MNDFFGLREISAQVDGFVWGWIMIASSSWAFIQETPMPDLI